MKFHVRIWGMDASGRPFKQEAVTEAVSAGEVCLSGFVVKVTLNDVLGISCEGRKGRFRVTAVGATTSTVGQIVLRAMDTSQNIWGLDFSQAATAERPERRTVNRYYCKGAISIWQEGSAHPMHLGVSDISVQGCYVDVTYALPPGARISLVLNLSDVVIRAQGEVCTSHAAVGMGVRFDSMEDSDRAKLEKFVAELAAAASSPSEPPILR